MKLLTFFFFIPFFSNAQLTDFLLLKKKNQTVATYFTGSPINITTTTGAFINAEITAIKNDSVFLKQYIVRQVPTTLGVYILDTVTSYRYQYHYNQIAAIAKTGRHFDWAGSGAVLLGGGTLLVLGSVIVYLADNKNFSPKLMIGAASLAAIGYLLTRLKDRGMVIGKKYSLVYVNASAKKP